MSDQGPSGGSGAVGSVKPIYGLDDRPELPRTIVLGAQHVLTMFDVGAPPKALSLPPEP